MTEGRGPARQTRLSVGDVAVLLAHEVPAAVRFDPAYDRFRVEGGPTKQGSDAPFRFQVRPLPFPEIRRERLLFDTGSHWSVFDTDLGPAIANSAAGELETLTGVVVVPREDAPGPPGDGVIVHIHAGSAGASVEPLEQPLGQLLWREILPRREALLLHAAGLVVDGRALVFVGHSGAGKSTLLRQFPSAGVLKLSDDRVVVRWRDDGTGPRWWVHGTPWPGEDRIIDPGTAPLAAIFLLEHAPRNELCSVDGARAVAEVSARTFLPYWSEQGIGRTIELAHRLVTRVPLLRFPFAPTPEAALFLLEHFTSQGRRE